MAGGETPSDSEPEENAEKSSSSTENHKNGEDEEEIPEYEKQRLSRIRENKARLEALGLPTLASSLLRSIEKNPKAKGKGKKKVSTKTRKEDDEYRPSEEEEDGESSSTEEENEDDQSSGDDSSSGWRRSVTRKGKGKHPPNVAKQKKTWPIQRDVNELDLTDDDVSLQQAIALSLGGSPDKLPSMLGGFSHSSATSKNAVGHHGRQEGNGVHEAARRRKRKKQNISRVQLTEDEVIAYFFSFDEAGKGEITVRDLKRVAEAHDFNWTDKEITDMIDCFDSDKDGKLNLGDFRTIVGRCNMIQVSENVEMGV